MSEENAFAGVVKNFKAPKAAPTEAPPPPVEAKQAEIVTGEDLSVAARAAALGLTEEEMVKRDEKKLARKSEKQRLGTAPTMLGTPTPVPPRMDTPAPPPAATYLSIEIRLDQAVIAVGESVKVIVVGTQPDHTVAIVEDYDFAHEPMDAGVFDKASGLFKADKAGVVTFTAMILDPTSGTHEAPPVPFTVITPMIKPEPSVSVTPSLKEITAVATAKHEREQREQHDTLGGPPAVTGWFRRKPSAMTVGGTPIYAPELPPRRSWHVTAMNAVNAQSVRTVAWIKQHWLASITAVLAGLFTIGFVFAALTTWGNSANDPVAVEAPLPPDVTVATVTDGGADLIAPVVPPTTPPDPRPTVSPEPGLTGPHGEYIRASARIAFPLSCADYHSPAFAEAVHILCGLHERRGTNVCGCDVAGFIP